MGKLTNKWKLNSIQLYSHWFKKKIKREIRKYFNTSEIIPPLEACQKKKHQTRIFGNDPF